jgi:hypothetical protein
MLFGYSMLATALLLSSIAAYYSVMGLTAIFAAATLPVIIMGGSLELGKVMTTVWLHHNWKRVSLVFKAYLVPAVIFLMLLTSMGIFGYLSKAHLDQNIPSGDAQNKVVIYDEKIKTARDNIESARRALKQMDESVDQLMARTTDDTGAQRAANLRRSQLKERSALQADIQKNQADIAKFNEERAPLAAEFRKIEAEVGPIKYIAALIYGESANVDVMEKAVRFMIIMIVIVFDPLALTLILAANKQIEWARQDSARIPHNEEFEPTEETNDADERVNQEQVEHKLAEIKQDLDTAPEPGYDADAGQLTQQQLAQIQELANSDRPTGEVVARTELFAVLQDPPTPEWSWSNLPTTAAYPDSDFEVDEFSQAKQAAREEIISKNTAVIDPTLVVAPMTVAGTGDYVEVNGKRMHHKAFDPGSTDAVHAVERHVESLQMQQPNPVSVDKIEKLAAEEKNAQPENDGNVWVPQPDGTWINAGPLDQFNLGLLADNAPASAASEMRGFGTRFPTNVDKGSMFLRVDRLPSALYKFNGTNWIEVDKTLSNQYLYDEAYIDHLIEKISSGEYDPQWLSDAEQESIEKRLAKKA